MTRSIVTNLLLTLTIAIAAKSQPGLIIKGSETCQPLTQVLSNSFVNKTPGFKITNTGGGSAIGFNALLMGDADVAQSSREVNLEEKYKLVNANKDYKTYVVALDALAVIVNKTNPVNQLTQQQIEGIFTGVITNWKEIGGPDMKIVVFSRESSSGTYEFFKEYLLKMKNYTPSALHMPTTKSIIESIAQTEGGISYVGLAHIDPAVKPLKISYDNGKTFVEPSDLNAKSKKYPVVRPLYFYYLLTTEEKVKPLINYISSPEGQEIIKNEGYITVE